jgi:hypothetical protein
LELKTGLPYLCAPIYFIKFAAWLEAAN